MNHLLLRIDVTHFLLVWELYHCYKPWVILILLIEG
jgi:hypothetical protein